MLPSIARERFTEHSDRLSRVTLAVSLSYSLVAQSVSINQHDYDDDVRKGEFSGVECCRWSSLRTSLAASKDWWGLPTGRRGPADQREAGAGRREGRGGAARSGRRLDESSRLVVLEACSSRCRPQQCMITCAGARAPLLARQQLYGALPPARGRCMVQLWRSLMQGTSSFRFFGSVHCVAVLGHRRIL